MLLSQKFHGIWNLEIVMFDVFEAFYSKINHFVEIKNNE